MRKLKDITGPEAMRLTSHLIMLGYVVMRGKTMRKYAGRKIPKGMDPDDYNQQFAVDFFNALLDEYQDDFTPILAEIEGVPLADYLASANPDKIMADVDELMKDSDFTSLFFASEQSRTRTSSGSASENTEAQTI